MKTKKLILCVTAVLVSLSTVYAAESVQFPTAFAVGCMLGPE